MSSSLVEKPVPCIVKPLQLLSIGATDFASGCGVIDISFSNMMAVNLKKITFRNFYTATCSVKLKMPRKNSDGDMHVGWGTELKNYKLMLYPQYETNGEKQFTLNASDFRHRPTEVSGIRFVLRQPSPCWKSFTISEIQIYSHSSAHATVNQMPKWLVSGEDDLYIGISESDTPPHEQAKKQGLPDPEDLSQKLHDMWTLTQVTQDSQPITDSTLGRFDIDGCYEINLLSYT